MSENKTVVVYRSKSGFVKKYAEWIAADLTCDILEGSHVKLSDLLTYETIIYGGGLYAEGINGLTLITKNFEKLKDRKTPDADEKGMLASYDHPQDFTKRDRIAPIVQLVKGKT